MPESKEERDKLIFDLVLLHQLLLERFKLYQTATFNPVLREAARAVRLTLSKIDYETVRELSRKELNQLVNTLSTIDVFDEHIEEQKRVLERLSFIETETYHNIITVVSEKKIRSANAEAIWTFTRNEPLAASFLFGALDAFRKRIGMLFAQTVHKNYVAGASVAILKNEIIGTRSKSFRDGLLSRVKKQSDVLMNSLIQHVSSISNEKVASLAYTRYEWVSMLESTTCAVCEGLHGEIFNLGEGPRPPIHYNCGCSMVPIEGTGRTTPPLNEWMDAQTSEFKRALNRPLSLSEYDDQVTKLGE